MNRSETTAPEKIETRASAQSSTGKPPPASAPPPTREDELRHVAVLGYN